MTQAKKRAIFTFLIWGTVMTAFSIIFFSGGGPEKYAAERWRHVAGAGMIAFGYLAFGLMLWLTRLRAIDRSLGRDERDATIQKQASSTGFLIVLIYVFALAIYLWDRYQTQGFVPVGWMWFLAYSTSFAAFISTSLIALFLESRISSHG